MESGSLGIVIISANRPVRPSQNQDQAANTSAAPVQHARHVGQHSSLTRFGCFNICSVNKVDEVRMLMQEEKLNELALTETWHEDFDCTISSISPGCGSKSARSCKTDR